MTMTVALEMPMGDSRPVMIVGPMQMFGRRDNGERDCGREKQHRVCAPTAEHVGDYTYPVEAAFHC
jgi:hypothetical protein